MEKADGAMAAPRGTRIIAKNLRLAVAALLLCLASFATARADDAAPRIGEAAVFYDARYPLSWMTPGAAESIRDFALAAGMKAVDGDSADVWIHNRVRNGEALDSILLMAADIFPVELVGRVPSPNCLLMKYLRAGGSLVWLGDSPFYYSGDRQGKRNAWDAAGGKAVMGFDTHGDWRTKGIAGPTLAGRLWGIERVWESERAVKPADVNEILAENPNGAAAWAKRFSPRSERGGFIRLWDRPVRDLNEEQTSDLYRVLSYAAPARFEERRLAGSIEPIVDNVFFPTMRMDETGATRDVLISAFNAAGGEREYLLRGVRGRELLFEMELYKGSGIYYRKAIAAPIVNRSERLQLVVNMGQQESVLDSVHIDTDEVLADAALEFNPQVNPVDLGRALIPDDVAVAATGQTGRLHIEYMYVGRALIQARLNVQIERAAGSRLTTAPVSLVPFQYGETEMDIDIGEHEPGEYELRCALMRESEEGDESAGRPPLFSKNWTLKIVPAPEEKKPFGAFETTLDYDGKVYIYDRKENLWSSSDWKPLWESATSTRDVEVAFENGERFVFWRGGSYAPFWASGKNVGMTYEWLEAAYGRGGLTDCIEPLQDKECRFSTVEILSSTPARAVVRWRYPLIDLDYRSADGERAEEIYTFYPDGVGVRNAKGWVVPDAWHEANEFIVLLPAGVQPRDVLPPAAVKIFNPLGERKETVVWPQPNADWRKGDPALFRVYMHRDDPATPFMVSRAFSQFIVQYDGWKIDGRYVSPSYWGDHWPVTRGHPTATSAPKGWRERPTHASLMAIDSKPDRREPALEGKELVEWSWLIGKSGADDDALKRIAGSWLRPGLIEGVKGAKYVGYDRRQRAWFLSAEPGAEKITFVIKPEAPIVNPAFVVENWPQERAQVFVNGQPVEGGVLSGVEETGGLQELVLFLYADLSKPAFIELRPGANPVPTAPKPMETAPASNPKEGQIPIP